jgi:hypothetical protein
MPGGTSNSVPGSKPAGHEFSLPAEVIAEIDAVILRKEKAVAQFGHATGELRHELARF